MSAYVRMQNPDFIALLMRLLNGKLSPSSSPSFLEGGQALRQIVDTFLGLQMWGCLSPVSPGEYQLHINNCEQPLQLIFSPQFFGGDHAKKRLRVSGFNLADLSPRYFVLQRGSDWALSWHGGLWSNGIFPEVSWHAGKSNTRRKDIQSMLGGLDLDPAKRPTCLSINGQNRQLYWPEPVDRDQPADIRRALDRGPLAIYPDEPVPAKLEVGQDDLTCQAVLDLRRSGWAVTAVSGYGDGFFQGPKPVPLPEKLPWRALCNPESAA